MASEIAGRGRIVYNTTTQKFDVYASSTGSAAPISSQTTAAAADSALSTSDTGKGYTYPARGDRKH